MRRWSRFVSIAVPVCLFGLTLVAGGSASTAAVNVKTDISRPIIWASGQDSGQVFVVNTKTQSVVKDFDFLHGTGGTPQILGVGGPTPGQTIASPKPHLITFSPDSKFAYVTFQNTNPGTIAVINTTTLAVQTLITIPTGLPSTSSPRVTEAKSSPDGTFLLVGEIGPPGILVRVNVNEPALTWTVDVPSELTPPNTPVLGNPSVTSGSQGPACVQFSPVDGSAYYDSSLSPSLGVGVVANPKATPMVMTTFFPTIGDPQCGFHDPILVNGVPTVIVTDSGTPTGQTNPNLGHMSALNTVNDTFAEFSFSPFFAKNLHDYWPVQLEPVGAPTTDAPPIIYGSDRDSDILLRINSATGGIQSLTMNPPDIQAPAGRGAIDTLDGSGNTVFGAMKETGDIVMVDNFSKQTFIHLTDPDPAGSCATSTNANFHKCFVVHALSVQPSPLVTVTGNLNQVVVPAGTRELITGAHVAGSITAGAGASVDIENSTVAGAVNSTGSTSFRMCGSTTGGSVTVSGATGVVLVGNPPSCLGNTIHGSLNLGSNPNGFVLAAGNLVGP